MKESEAEQCNWAMDWERKVGSSGGSTYEAVVVVEVEDTIEIMLLMQEDVLQWRLHMTHPPSSIRGLLVLINRVNGLRRSYGVQNSDRCATSS